MTREQMIAHLILRGWVPHRGVCLFNARTREVMEIRGNPERPIACTFALHGEMLISEYPWEQFSMPALEVLVNRDNAYVFQEQLLQEKRDAGTFP